MNPTTLAIVLSVLQIADGWITYQGIKRGAREEWPPMRWLMDRLGVCQTLVLTKGGMVLIAWGLALSNDAYRVPVLSGIIVVYALIVINNVVELINVRKRTGKS